jgi:hypothetical protein
MEELSAAVGSSGQVFTKNLSIAMLTQDCDIADTVHPISDPVHCH